MDGTAGAAGAGAMDGVGDEVVVAGTGDDAVIVGDGTVV